MQHKIHLVHFDAGPGGMEIILPVIVKNIPGKSFSAFLLRSHRDGINVYDDTGIKVSYGDNRNPVAYIKTFLYSRRHRNDIFHVFNIGPVFLFILRLAGIKKIIYSIHGTIYWKSNFKKKIMLLFWKLALHKKMVILANSAHSKNVFQKKISGKFPVNVLYNPVDVNRFAYRQKGFIEKEIRIIYTGRLAPGKNLPLWIDIAVKLQAKIPGCRFEIYGDGVLRESLMEQVKKLNAIDFIQLKGFRADIENVYRQADLLLFLSEYESFGNVVVESILCGTPVLTLPIPSMQEIFSAYPEFLLDDKIDLAEQVSEKINMLPSLKKTAQMASMEFLKKFSVENHIAGLEKIYDSF
jgi:glycosyltransferase involved in cell wall biosynthesis